MDTDKFWQLIETSHVSSQGDNEQQFEILVDALMNESVEDIREFERIFYVMMKRANYASLWEAADVIACGCSDDGFLDFRSWLIAQGKAVFEAAIADPESLADIIDTDHRYDVMRNALAFTAGEAHRRFTGKEIPLVIYGDTELVGQLGSEKNRAAKFPRLSAKLGDCDKT